MGAWGVLAFLNLGVTETIIIGVVALLLFGPRLARTMGQVGGTLLRLKKDVEDTKQGVARTLERELGSALRGSDSEKPRDEKAQGEKPGQKKGGEAEEAEEEREAEG